MLDSLNTKRTDQDPTEHTCFQAFKDVASKCCSNPPPEKKATGTKYVRNLIPGNLNKIMNEFVYEVNFEAGKGQEYLHIFACIALRIKACDYLNKFDALYHHISIKSFEVDLFKDLIGKIKKIISEERKTVGSASSVTDAKYTEWNKLLCQIIILASFTKINQAEFWQFNVDKVVNHI